jgi:hypothetical protein
MIIKLIDNKHHIKCKIFNDDLGKSELYMILDPHSVTDKEYIHSHNMKGVQSQHVKRAQSHNM